MNNVHDRAQELFHDADDAALRGAMKGVLRAARIHDEDDIKINATWLAMFIGDTLARSPK